MGILTWIILGLVAGLIAKFVMPGNDPGGLIVTILVGIAGAIIGGFIASAFGFGAVSGFNIRSIVIAAIGAFALLFALRVLKRSYAPPGETANCRPRPIRQLPGLGRPNSARGR